MGLGVPSLGHSMFHVATFWYMISSQVEHVSWNMLSGAGHTPLMTAHVHHDGLLQPLPELIATSLFSFSCASTHHGQHDGD